MKRDNSSIRNELLAKLRTQVRLPDSSIGMVVELGLKEQREDELLLWLKEQNDDNKRRIVMSISVEVSLLLDQYEPEIASKFD